MCAMRQYTAGVNSAGQHDQLNAILGVALRALVDAGADPQFLATFVERYRAEFAKHLNVTVEAAPDLHAVIVAAVREVVGPVRSQTAGRAKTTQSINVMVNGQRTTVSVRLHRLQAVQQLVGTNQAARKVVREVAAAAPSDLPNGARSEWIDKALDGFLKLRQSEVSGAQPH